MHRISPLTLYSAIGLCSMLLLGCRSAPVCENISAKGNLYALNSPANELMPVWYQNSHILFVSDRQIALDSGNLPPASEQRRFLITTRYRDGWSKPQFLTQPPINQYPSGGGMSYFFDSTTGMTEIFFAAESEPGNADLFVIYGQNGQWTTPQPLQALNTSRWEAYPAISPDGSFLVFTSDRPNGSGGLDLFISFRLGKMQWSIPQPLTELNSPWDELSPVIDNDGTLYFATQAMSAQRTFDIVRAVRTESGQWARPELLPYPINTESDEITPQLLRDSLLLASNRPGGCGQYDLYLFPLCAPITLDGIVHSPRHYNETILIFDENNQLYHQASVRADGKFRLELPGHQRYRLVYHNPCYSGAPLQTVLSLPCTLQPSIAKVEFHVPELDSPSLELPKTIEIPYFVPGYYRLSTRENLQQLRLLHDMHLWGLSNPSIPMPDSTFDLYAPIVEHHLSTLHAQLTDYLVRLNDPCYEGHHQLAITIEGYASETEIDSTTRYMGPEIWDQYHNIYVVSGIPMTRSLLALLRAYFTFQYLQQTLHNDPTLQPLAQQIQWHITAAPVSIAVPNEPKERKVRIVLNKAVVEQKF